MPYPKNEFKIYNIFYKGKACASPRSTSLEEIQNSQGG